MADIAGSITIKSTIDNSELKPGTKEFANAINSIKSAAAKAGTEMSGSFNSYLQAMYRVRSSASKMAGSYKDIQKEITSTSDALAKLQARQEKMRIMEDKRFAAEKARLKEQKMQEARESITSSLGQEGWTKLNQKDKDRVMAEALRQYEAEVAKMKHEPIENSQAWQSLQYDIDMTTAKMDGLIRRRDELRDSQGGQTAGGSASIGMKAASTFLDDYMRKWNQMTTLSGTAKNALAGAITPVLHPIQAADRALGALIPKIGQAISSFARMAGNGAISFLKRIAVSAKNAAVQLAKLTANAVTSGLKKLASGASAAAKGLLGIGKQSKASNGGLKAGLKTIMKYAFGIRSMFFLFRKLRAAISEGFGELKKQNPEVKTSLDGLTRAFNSLKGSLASAFAPILTAVAPALTTLINMLTSAMNVVAAFMAALGGGKTFSKAVGGIKGVGKSAGGAGKKVKELKRELAGFDELTIINDQNKSGGGGGGGGGGSALKYQTEQIPESIKTFVDTLKKKWEEGDYESVGNLVAQKINGVFESALKLITWENVEDKVEAGVSAVAGVFNGLTDPNKGIKFGQIGTVFSAGVRTLINAIDRLVKKISTANIGIGIANFFNGILDNRALFDDAKQGLQDVTTAVTNLAAAFLQEFNEGTLAQRIRDTLGDSAMWEGIGKEVWNVITLAFNKTGNFLNVLLGGEDKTQDLNVTRMMRQKPKDIVPEFQIDGTVFDDLATNLTNGINTALESVTEFISNHSPTNAIYALAGWITKIRNGIHWDVVGNFLGTSFKSVLDGLGAWITEWSGEAETIGGDIATAINGFIDAAFNGDTIADYFTKAVKGAFSLVKGFVEKINEEKAATEIKEAIEGIDWNGIAETAWEAFKTAVSKLGNFLTVLFGGDITPDAENAVDAVEQMWDRHSGKNTVTTDLSAEGLAKTVGGAVSAILEQLDKWITGLDWPEIGAGLHDFLENLPWEDWGQKLATALHDLLTNIDDFISAATFGENYKDNNVWRFFHTGKAAEYDVGKAVSSSTNAEDVLKKYGLTEKSFAQLKALADSPIISDPDMLQAVQEAQSKVAAIMAELDGAGITEPIGEASADGLVQGVENKSTDIENAGKDMGAALSGGASDELDINSPSKVFENIGEMVVAGLINGLNILPAALKGVWNNLPAWAQTLLGNSASNFKLAISGGGDNGGGNSSAQTKETKKNTKELKKNTKKRAEVDVNYEGAGFDTSGEKPTLNVGVNFTPNGEEASEENTNGGLLGWLQTLLDPGVSVETKVEMIREGWTSFLNFLGIDTNNPLIQTAIQLIRNNFESFLNFLGVDTSNPLIKTIIDLVSGKKDSGAEKVLNAGGTVRDAIVNTLLHKGTGANWVEAAWTALTKNSNSPISTVGLVAAKGAAWVANAWTALTKTGNNPISTVGLAAAKGANWVANAWTALTKTSNSATSTVGVKQSDHWNDNAFTALTKTKNSATSTVKLKKASGSNWNDKAYKMATKTTNTITTKLKLSIGNVSNAVKNVVNAIAALFEGGGIVDRYGKVSRFASGGAIMRNGRASWWNSVNKYAAGTTRAHGTVFVAGENGPEIMGHVNGRTEILNKSQLADAMYGAVVAGMSNAVNALGSYLANRMATCTNAIVSTISANSDISALAGMNYYAPAMATGGIMPYDVAMQISRSAQDIQNTLNANNEDLIQAMVSAMNNAANSIAQVIQRQMLSTGSNGKRSTDAIDVINRQSLMFGKSPLKGV